MLKCAEICAVLLYRDQLRSSGSALIMQVISIEAKKYIQARYQEREKNRSEVQVKK